MNSPRPFIRALLIDLSGTLHIGDTPTKDAVNALRRLRQAGIPFRFCSNTSKESTTALRERLTHMGFEIRSDGPKEELWTSIGAVKRRIEDLELKRPYLLLSDSAHEEISSAIASSEENPFDSVVVGLAPKLFNYDSLNSAFRVLTESHGSSAPETKSTIPIIATHRAKYIRSSDGALSLGPGPFVKALENASDLQAQVVGKPSRSFFDTVIGNFQEDELSSLNGKEVSGQVAVIGDDVEADLGEGAVELGLWRVLVKTGKYRPGDEHKLGLEAPDETCESFAAFVDSFLQSLPSRL